MKKNAIVYVLLVVFLLIGGFIIYRMVTPVKPGFACDNSKTGMLDRVVDALTP